MSAIVREVYVISDLHLGGAKGFEMMRRPDVLAAFIEGLSRVATPPKELVIAGDFVDFLAEETKSEGEPLAFVEDPVEAASILERIAGPPSPFAGIFQALRELNEAASRQLWR